MRDGGFNRRIAELLDLAYHLAKCSLLFWRQAARQVFIFGMLSAFCAMVETIKEYHSGSSRRTGEVYREYADKYSGLRKGSLAVSGLAVYMAAFILLPFPDQIGQKTAAVIKYVFLYAFVLLAVWSVYVCLNATERQLEWKQAMRYGFYLLIKRFFRTAGVAAVFILLAVFCRMNLLFLLFFAPGLYAAAGYYVLRPLYKEDPGGTEVQQAG